MSKKFVDVDAIQDRAFQLKFDFRITERELAIVNRLLLEAPSADVVERKRGKWVADGKPVDPERDSCWCSVCGAWLVGSDEYHVDHNFCPNCGADMRGEKQDG